MLGAMVLAGAAARLLGGSPPEVVLAAWLGGAAVLDARTSRIPNGWVGAGLAVVAGFVALVAPKALLAGLAGSLVGAGLVLLMRGVGYVLRGVPGMGLGDAKTMAVVGLALGPWPAAAVLWGGLMLAGLYAGTGVLLGWFGRDHRFPFVPFLALSLGLYLLAEPYLEAWRAYNGWP